MIIRYIQTNNSIYGPTAIPGPVPNTYLFFVVGDLVVFLPRGRGSASMYACVFRSCHRQRANQLRQHILLARSLTRCQRNWTSY